MNVSDFKLDAQHCALIAIALASALGPTISQISQGQPINIGMLIPALVALTTTGAALLKPSIRPSANESAVFTGIIPVTIVKPTKDQS